MNFNLSLKYFYSPPSHDMDKSLPKKNGEEKQSLGNTKQRQETVQDILTSLSESGSVSSNFSATTFTIEEMPNLEHEPTSHLKPINLDDIITASHI